MDTYEKKYKEALSRARQFSEHPLQEDSESIVEYIFPELKESEDERIRKAIHIYLDWLDGRNKDYQPKGDYSIKDMITWLEKQGDNPIKWNKNTKDYKPQKNHSVLMKTTHGIAEGEWQGVHWLQYRWSGIIKDSDVIAWIELSDLEKQGRQKPTWSEEDENISVAIENHLIEYYVEKRGYPYVANKTSQEMKEFRWLKSLKQRIGG